jgi:hypothetical protein
MTASTPLANFDQLARGGIWIAERVRLDELHAAARSSLSAPRITILSASSSNGRCNAFASSQGARIQTSRSSPGVRITGIAFAWIGATTAFGE